MTTTGDVGQRARFDVRDFARTAHGNFRDTLDLAEYESAPLGEETLHAIRYLGRLESATMEHLRNLLVTATHKDARVTAFLVTWAFEKFWIADALDSILEANGEPRAQSVEEGKRRTGHAESNDRRGPIRRAVSAIRLGVPIIAVHTTTGLVDEWVTRAAYLRLAEKSGSASLNATVSTILEIKQRHAEFFEDDSRRRLADSPKSVRLTREALVKAAWPIGAVDRAAADRSFFESYLFGGEQGVASAELIESKIAALPGLDRGIGASVAQKLLP
jgi:hypothetical protein